MVYCVESNNHFHFVSELYIHGKKGLRNSYNLHDHHTIIPNIILVVNHEF